MNSRRYKTKGGLQEDLDRIAQKKLRHKKALERAYALEDMVKLDHPFIASELLKSLSDSSPVVRWTAALHLGERKERKAIDPLIGKLSDRDYEVRMRSVEALGNILEGKKKCPSALIKGLRDPHELVRIEVAEALGAIGDRKALPGLWRRIHDRDPLVRRYIASAVGALGNKIDARKLERELPNERSKTARLGYYQALYELGRHDILPDLILLFQSSDYRVRCATAHTLSAIVDRSNRRIILDALKKALKQEVTVAAKSSIRTSMRRVRSSISNKSLS